MKDLDQNSIIISESAVSQNSQQTARVRVHFFKVTNFGPTILQRSDTTTAAFLSLPNYFRTAVSLGHIWRTASVSYSVITEYLIILALYFLLQKGNQSSHFKSVYNHVQRIRGKLRKLKKVVTTSETLTEYTITSCATIASNNYRL